MLRCEPRDDSSLTLGDWPERPSRPRHPGVPCPRPPKPHMPLFNPLAGPRLFAECWGNRINGNRVAVYQLLWRYSTLESGPLS